MANQQYISIKSWAEDERPREKLYNKGAESLANSELIAILLGSGSRELSAVDLARNILNSVDNNLASLGRLSVHELVNNYKGVGAAKATTIAAALELGRRRKAEDVRPKLQIKSSADVANYMIPFLSDLTYEEFWVLFLARDNTIIDEFKASKGGVSGTLTDVRLILKRGINVLASNMILLHNHPSGNLSPSKSDIKLTEHIYRAAVWMNIHLVDHLIIAKEKYYSFAEYGYIEAFKHKKEKEDKESEKKGFLG